MFIIVFSLLSKSSREDSYTRYAKKQAEAEESLYYRDGKGKYRLTSTGQEVIPSHRGEYTVLDDVYRKCLLDKHLNIIMCIDWEYKKDLNEHSKAWFFEHGYKGYIHYIDPRSSKRENERWIEFETGREYILHSLPTDAYLGSGLREGMVEYIDSNTKMMTDFKYIHTQKEYDTYNLTPSVLDNSYDSWLNTKKRLKRKWCFN